MGAAASSSTRDAPRKYAVPASSPAAAADAESAAAATAPTPLSAPVRGPGSAPAPAAMPVSQPTTLRVETSLLPKERRVKPALRDPRVVPARFVDFAELKDHGRLPRFGSNPKYVHPVTKEGNANMCHFREDFKMRTIFVFVSHFWGTEQEDDDVIAQQEVMPHVGRTRWHGKAHCPGFLGVSISKLYCATMPLRPKGVRYGGGAQLRTLPAFNTTGVGAPERSARCGGQQEDECQWRT